MTWTANYASRDLNKEVVMYLILRLGGSRQLVKLHSNMNAGSHTG